ncbi:hypothetical protein BQ8794_140141 [Mesorhizobium prunaredense]|uniref:Uncharacterized protein n=1 Tax=Mesorhizobium prunaredense TaxID=1631249 RepID=A0A1R3V5G1_9HYPH|nr:hypothetical protein BQ8794_140141 [Mesorhizobium prunaredense]
MRAGCDPAELLEFGEAALDEMTHRSALTSGTVSSGGLLRLACTVVALAKVENAVRRSRT